MKIRPFRYTDTDSLIYIAEHSFAEEMAARGTSPQDFINQVRTVTRGRMIPFRILNRLSGTRWGLFVAEVEGEVVGCGGYLGQKHMELANLMVHPDYRRRGIGQALLVKRLEHLARQGHEYVTTTVLATNKASWGNLKKQNFVPFDQYTVYETALPYAQATGDGHSGLTFRPITEEDQALFEAVEHQVTGEDLLRIEGSRWSEYAPPSGAARFTSKMWGTRRWQRAFEKNGALVGFLAARVDNNSPAGSILRPLVPDQHLDALPAMLREATSWVSEQGKTAVQTAASATRPVLGAVLEDTGWNQGHTWIRLVRSLNQEPVATGR